MGVSCLSSGVGLGEVIERAATPDDGLSGCPPKLSEGSATKSCGPKEIRRSWRRFALAARARPTRELYLTPCSPPRRDCESDMAAPPPRRKFS